MIKTILAFLSGTSSDRTVLDTAVAAAKVNGGHVQCLHTRMDPMETVALYGAIAPRRLDVAGQIAQEIYDDERQKSEHAKAAFQDSCQRHALTMSDIPLRGGVSTSWREAKAVPEQLRREVRFHDLIVMARDVGLSSGGINSVLMQGGRPLLLAPPKPIEFIGRRMAVAWKDGPEAAHALTAASPFLSRADHVTVIAVSEDAADSRSDRDSAEDLARQLRWYGPEVEVRFSDDHSGQAAAKIRETAYECNADMLVMGGYGHSRLQEFIFGGVTRSILSECAIPVLMHR